MRRWWWLALIPAILLGLHATGILPLAWTDRPLEGFQPVAGASYAVPVQTMWMSAERVTAAPIEITEDGRPLACAHSPSSAIPQNGLGRYELETGFVFLSSSDNSDPRTNGRHYVLRWPTLPPLWLTALCVIVFVAGSVAGAWANRDRLRALIAAPPLWFSLSLLIVPLVAHRWWFYADIPLPAVQPDSGSYFSLARSLFAGEWPRFEIRPPAYPVFLGAALALTHSMLGVTIVQTLVTALCGSLAVFAVHRLKPSLAPLAALALAAFVTGLWHLEHDTTLLSESLYVNAIVAGVGLVILALASGRRTYFAFASTAFGVAILTRPAGLFLAAPYAICIAFLIVNREMRRHLLAFCLPLPLLLIGLSVYNFFAAKQFTVSAWGEANLTVATLTMWDVSPAYPEAINTKIAAIRAVIQGRLTDEERNAIQSSWDPDLLAPAFLKGFYQPALNDAMALSPGFQDSRRLMRQISLDAIRTHPVTYAKFVWTMSYLFHVRNISYQADFADFLRYRVQNLFMRKTETPDPDPISTDLIRTYFHQERPAGVDIGGVCTTADNPIRFLPTTGRRVHRLMARARDNTFGRAIWVYAALAVWLAAVLRLIVSRGRHLGAFVLVFVGLQAIAAGLVVALVEYGGQRYSYPTEFAYYLTVALAPLLWMTLPRPNALVDVRN